MKTKTKASPKEDEPRGSSACVWLAKQTDPHEIQHSLFLGSVVFGFSIRGEKLFSWMTMDELYDRTDPPIQGKPLIKRWLWAVLEMVE